MCPSQAEPLRPPPQGPAATFDRCALQSVQLVSHGKGQLVVPLCVFCFTFCIFKLRAQHMRDYEAVPYEATKALRALASLAYSEPVEVVTS